MCAATLSLKSWFTDGSHGKHQVLCCVLSRISVTSSRCGSASKICSDDRKCLRQLVEGSQSLAVQWQREGNQIPEDPHIHIVFHNQEVIFRIRACEAHDGGKYTCRIENEAGRAECSAMLVVQGSSASCLILLPNTTAPSDDPPVSHGVLEPSSIQERPEVVRVACGDPVRLECRVAGTPQITVRWSKEGKDLESSSKHHLFHEDNLCCLSFESCELEDQGEYLLEATKPVGFCSCRVTLVVLGV